eukprot:TRINITY_DN1419_c0_g1_i2.p1 TRINITY_DN1419_c0_g1~~TRINITY_DN1419_c0_g1_i2.p1  ORF type:complete len:464 (+),score=10.15 TRINITY_DN1419_c0_g1_i2:166-1557(+)
MCIRDSINAEYMGTWRGSTKPSVYPLCISQGGLHMKKTLAVLLALILVGAAFAQTTAPAAAAAAPAVAAPTIVKLADPVVTYGLTGSFSLNALQGDTFLGLKDKSSSLKGTDSAILGFSYKDGQGYKIEPWAQIALGDFSVKATYGYKAPYYDFNAAKQTAALTATSSYDQLAKVAFGVSHDGLTLTSTFVYDHNNYSDASTPAFTVLDQYYNDTEFDVTKDSFEGGLLMRTDLSGTDETLTGIGLAGDLMRNAKMVDWYFKISKIADIATVSVGGTSTNWDTYNFRDYGLFPSTTVINYQASSRSTVGFWFCGNNTTTIPVYTEYDLSKWVPITLKTGIIVPTANSLITPYDGTNSAYLTPMYTWLEGQNQVYAAAFNFKGIGSGEIGLYPEISTAVNMVAASATQLGDKTTAIGDYYVSKPVVSNVIFGDFNLGMVPNLTAHVLCVDTCLLYTSPSPRDQA